MKRLSRFSIAVLLVAILALTASGVWASQKFHGTTPYVPKNETVKKCTTVDMGTVLVTPLGSSCTASVQRIGQSTGEYVAPPEGLAVLGETFEVSVKPAMSVKICFAYPPKLAEKGAKIYRLNQEADPDVWVEVPSEAKNGVICATSSPGVFSLMGTK